MAIELESTFRLVPISSKLREANMWLILNRIRENLDQPPSAV